VTGSETSLLEFPPHGLVALATADEGRTWSVEFTVRN